MPIIEETSLIVFTPLLSLTTGNIYLKSTYEEEYIFKVFLICMHFCLIVNNSS